MAKLWHCSLIARMFLSRVIPTLRSKQAFEHLFVLLHRREQQAEAAHDFLPISFSEASHPPSPSSLELAARIVAQPQRQPTLPQEVFGVSAQLLQTGAGNVGQFHFHVLRCTGDDAAFGNSLHARSRCLHI